MSGLNRNAAMLAFAGIGLLTFCYFLRKKSRSTTNRPSLITSPLLVSSKRRVHIMYGTTTGTSRKFAFTLYHHIIRKCDFDLKITDLKDYDENTLSTEDIVIFITSTYEDGTAPPSCSLFFNDLNDQAFDFRVPKDLLSKVTFAVFGCGGKIFEKNYCKVAKELDSLMERLGGNRMNELIIGDDASNLETLFYKWNSVVVKELRKISPLLEAVTEELGSSKKEIKKERCDKKDASSSCSSSTPNSSNASACCGKDKKEGEQEGKGTSCKGSSDNKDEEDESCSIDEDEEDEEDKINNNFVTMDNEDEEEDEEALADGVMDMEEIGSALHKMKKNNAVTVDGENHIDQIKREMVTKLQRKALTKEGYKIIGSHSAVKLCRWTKNQLRGRGGCYKHSFYGITSYNCMEATPSLACANKCVFCWRHHKNPVGTEWRWKEDNPSMIVEDAIKLHVGMIHELKGLPGVSLDRWHDAHTVKHCALSLVGEPIMYPRINEMLQELHNRHISTFLVTNAQFPDRIEQLDPVTQLYVSVDASTKDSLKAVDRPLFKDFWERFLSSLAALKNKLQRTVYRMTLVKSWNMNELENYVQLIECGLPGEIVLPHILFFLLCFSLLDFIEIKAVTYCGKSDASSLTMENVPWHQEVCLFGEEICKMIKARNICNINYSIATEHEHSCCILIAREDKFKVDNEWYTWIDYSKFQELIQEYYLSGKSKLFRSEDYRAKTPSWAVYQSKERGFDPAENRWRRKRLENNE
jgi:tRNA wybutosine-synthesizing protein 1